jgi:glutathione S-transferase
VKLYHSPGACSLAVHIVAREAGVPVELVPVDLATHRTATGEDYRAINPRGYVPLIELDDGTRLTEAAVLLQFLADMAPGSGLLPPVGTLDRVRVQGWLNFVATELHKAFSPWLWHKETAPDTQRGVREKLAQRFVEIERRLAGHAFLFGDGFTVADAYAFTILRWSPMLAVDLAPFPAIEAYLSRIAARPQVQAAMLAEGLVRRLAA